MYIEEVTDRLYLDAVRMATELVEPLDEKHVNHSLTELDINTKKAILSQYLAKAVILPGLSDSKEEG